jgi:hypothetical protein
MTRRTLLAGLVSLTLLSGLAARVRAQDRYSTRQLLPLSGHTQTDVKGPQYSP